jgi:phage terminase large subunit GpA-like protein
VAIGKPTRIDVNHGGTVLKRGAELYLIGVSVLKRSLYGRLHADGRLLEGSEDEREDKVPSIRFPTGLPDHYFIGLTGETFDPVKNKWIRREGQERNEELDTMVLALAAAMHQRVGVHKMQPGQWARLKEQYESAKPKAGEAQKPAPENRPLMPTPAPIKGNFSQW